MTDGVGERLGFGAPTNAYSSLSSPGEAAARAVGSATTARRALPVVYNEVVL